MKNSKFVWILVGLIIALVVAVFISQAQSQDPAYGGMGWTQGTGEIIIVMDPQIGDVNRDGKITNADVVALRLMRKYAHVGDVNGDNKVDEVDEGYLVDYILGEGDPPQPRTRCRSVRVVTPCWYEGAPLHQLEPKE